MIVHPIARRRHGGLEAQHVIRHAVEKLRGALAAPAVLAHDDGKLRHAHRQIILHDPRIHLLLRDGIAANRQPIAVPQDKMSRLRPRYRHEP